MLIAGALFGALVGMMAVDPRLFAAYGPLAPVLAVLLVLFAVNMRLRETTAVEAGSREARLNAVLLGGMGVCGLMVLVLVLRP